MPKALIGLFVSTIFLVGCISSADSQDDIKETIYDETGIEILIFEGYMVSALAASTHPTDQSTYSELQVAYQKPGAIDSAFNSEDVTDHIQDSTETGSYFTHVEDGGIVISYRPQPADLQTYDETFQVLEKDIMMQKLNGLEAYTFNHQEQNLTIFVPSGLYNQETIESIIELTLED